MPHERKLKWRSNSLYLAKEYTPTLMSCVHVTTLNIFYFSSKYKLKYLTCEILRHLSFIHSFKNCVLHHQTFLFLRQSPHIPSNAPSIHPLMYFQPNSHHWKPRPVGSPGSRCLLSPAHTARRSLSSRTCRSGTAWCSSASQTGNMLPRRRTKQGCYRRQRGGRGGASSEGNQWK